MALGAGADDVLRLIVRQAATVISIGLVLGLAGSFALTRSLNPRSSEGCHRSGHQYGGLAGFGGSGGA